MTKQSCQPLRLMVKQLILQTRTFKVRTLKGWRLEMKKKSFLVIVLKGPYLDNAAQMLPG